MIDRQYNRSSTGYKSNAQPAKMRTVSLFWSLITIVICFALNTSAVDFSDAKLVQATGGDIDSIIRKAKWDAAFSRELDEATSAKQSRDWRLSDAETGDLGKTLDEIPRIAKHAKALVSGSRGRAVFARVQIEINKIPHLVSLARIPGGAWKVIAKQRFAM